MDALVFMTDSIMDARNEGISTANTNSSSFAANKVSSPSVQLEAQEEQKLTGQQPDTDASTGVQRPVDLYKVLVFHVLWVSLLSFLAFLIPIFLILRFW